MSASVLYINADIAAPSKSVNAATAPVVQYSQTFTAPLVSKASDYFLSVLRWSAVGLDLPLFCPSVELGQSDPARTTYVVGASVQPAGAPLFKASANVQWAPQVLGLQVPQPPLTQQYLSPWYYCYDYQHVLDLVNATFQSVWANLQVQYQAWWTSTSQPGAFPGLARAAPQMLYDSASDCFTLFVARPSATAAESWTYFFNEPARGLFDHFPCAITPADALPYAVRLPENADGTFSLRQQRSSTDHWSPISAICLTTNMPIVSEENSPPNLLGAGNTNNGAGRSLVSVITDVALPLQRGDDYLGLVSYAPSGPYRRVQLVSGQPLSTVSFGLYWKSRLSGDLNPCGLTPDGSCSIKAVLERRF